VLCPASTTTGHALAHQPLEVSPPGPAGDALGFTGTKATHIVAELIVTNSVAKLATFTHYGKQASFPSSLEVPCSGTGDVRFVPVSGSPNARPYDVTVTFENLGTTHT